MTTEITHLSYSSISTYLDCARKWRFKYVDKIPTPQTPALAFGTAFHATVEEVIRRTSKLHGAPVVELWREYAAKEFAKLPELAFDISESPDELIKLGESMLMSDDVIREIGRIRPAFEDGEPIIEKRVEVRVPGVPVPVIGFIDLIDQSGVPHDFKTANNAWPKDRAAGELQTLFYLAALIQLGKPSPGGRFRHIVFPKGGKQRIQVFEHSHVPAELFWLFGLVREVWQAVQAGVFVPSPGSYLCSETWCPYWKLCKGKR